jgi:hypothetical protein
MLVTQAFSQHKNAAPGTRTPSKRDTGPSAVWQPGPDFVSKADAVCNASFSVHLSNAATQYGDCRIEQMAAAGAPTDAVNFAREFARQNLNEVVVMRSFRDIGSADLVSVIYPFRPLLHGSQVSPMTGLVLISPDANRLFVGDPNKIYQPEIEGSSWYQEFKKKYPKLHLLENRQAHGGWISVKQQEDETLQYRGGFMLNDGIRENQFLGFALFEWDFDASGKFLKARCLSFAPLPI